MLYKYDSHSLSYNQTRKADTYILKRIYELIDPKKGDRILDIGCGTGNYTIALHQLGLDMIGIDPSSGMLEKARSRNAQVEWIQGKAEKIPVANSSLDKIIGTLTLHHWSDLTISFSELHRVLKPGGKIVLFSSTPKQMTGYWLNHYFPKMMQDSMDQMPGLEYISKAMKKGGLMRITSEKYFIKDDLEDMFLYSGKHRPDLYLNAEFRSGSSSFSILSEKKDIEEGLKKLQDDIISHKISSIIKSYENEHGDYIFIIAEKPV
jgi:ubiquinone/menaquinone biosynthesis C-methylase UbiE